MTVNRAWNSRFMGWTCGVAARPVFRRRSVTSNFTATLNKSPIVLSHCERMTSAIINSLLEIGYDFWKGHPYFGMATAAESKGFGSWLAMERELDGICGGQRTQIDDKPKPFYFEWGGSKNLPRFRSLPLMSLTVSPRRVSRSRN